MTDTRRDLLKKAFVVPLIMSFPAIPAFARAGSGPPPSSGTWTVTYSTRGDISQVTQFYGPGAYLFLKTPTPDRIPVYLQHGGWSYLGIYGQGAPVPDGIPAVSFEGPYDQAVAVQR